uniref:Uncharacterized protein n=1 Tax=Anguilla anguilla TaxID=7936 RepID=A0A0E9V897_ANGAN
MSGVQGVSGVSGVRELCREAIAHLTAVCWLRRPLEDSVAHCVCYLRY